MKDASKNVIARSETTKQSQLLLQKRDCFAALAMTKWSFRGCLKKNNNGFLITELIVTLAVLCTVLTCFAMLLGHIRDLGKYNLYRQRCIQAANAQLDSISATGKPLPEEKLKSLWKEVTTQIAEASGTEQWQGLKLVKVKSTAHLGRKEIAVELARYINKNVE